MRNIRGQSTPLRIAPDPYRWANIVNNVQFIYRNEAPR
jgi:hypothetical protein